MGDAGIESESSAVQSQGTIIVDVRHCSKIPGNNYMLPYFMSPMFVIVFVGWCTNWSIARLRGR
jgi:hypothetical protein